MTTTTTTESMPGLQTFDRPAVTLDPDKLRRHLQGAPSATLLLCAVHATGDKRLLDRYADGFRVSDTPESRADLVEVLVGRATQGPLEQNLVVDDSETFHRMAEIAVGEQIDAEFLPLLLEQCGFVPDQPVVARTRQPTTLSVAILGAGMAGIAAGILAQRKGFEFEIFERAEDIGGTWRMNRYPGVAVDTPSLYYSYSFRLNSDWTKYYPVGTEYQQYLRRVVDEYGLAEKIRFGTQVQSLSWIESDDEWEIITQSLEGTRSSHRAKAVITAFGYLNRPKYANVAGIDTFAGQSIHSAHWKDMDLTGRRVAVIGAGATSVQLVPEVADQASHLTLFQRQPHWVMPPLQGTGTVPESESWLLGQLPFYNEWTRLRTYWAASDNGYGVVRADPEWMASHTPSISEANDAVMQFCREHIMTSFADRPDLQALMTPDYAPAGKRLVRDPGRFYSTLKKPHVEVVDEALSHVVPEGIVTADGRTHEVDVIVHATGFTLDFLSPIDIRGREGKTLNEVWKNGTDPVSYLAGTVPGFPNLFVTSGPNTSPAHGGGHNFPVESILHYVFECLQLLVEKGASHLEPTLEAVESSNRDIEALYENSVWSTQRGAHTYYRNEHGRIILPSPYRMIDFWSMHRAPDETAFHIE